MAVCRLLTLVYGRDTRSTQVFNLLSSLIWLVLLLLHIKGTVTLSLPVLVAESITDTIYLAIGSLAFAVFGMVTHGRTHQVFKFFGLSLGAVLQGALANGYFKAYPPLDMMLIVCLSLLLWYVGALYYIIRCEGLYGKP